MGLLDSAKNKLTGSFGDETVRIVDYDAEILEREKKEKEPKPKKTPPKKPEKPRKPTRSKEEKSEEEINLETDQGGHTKKRKLLGKDNDSNQDLEELLKQEESSEIDFDESEVEIDDDAMASFNNSHSGSHSISGDDDPNGSFFDLDDEDNFLKKQQAAYDKEMAMYANVPSLQVMENRIQDILEVMDIPATFAIESDIFLPDDVKDIVFDLQAPFGYDQGQVELFLQKARNTVVRYFELLTIRNEHVAKLATVIDKQQVDANNLRYQNEINNGINIMPSSDSDDIESQLVEAKLQIRQLEDQIKYNKIGHGQDINEPTKMEELYNQISILTREKEQLEEENYYLKNQVASLEYEIDEDEESSPQSSNQLPDATLPTINVDNLESSKPNVPKPTISNSAFDLDEDDDLEESNQTNNILKSNATDKDKNIIIDDEEEDEDMLDIIMKDWNPEDE